MQRERDPRPPPTSVAVAVRLRRRRDHRDRGILRGQRSGVEDRPRLALHMGQELEEGIRGLQEPDARCAVVHRNDPTRRQTVNDRGGLLRSGRGTAAHGDDPADGRRALLELTDRGRQTLEADRRQRVGWLIGAIAENFSEQEQQALAQAVPLLTRLADS
jgi:hypothetical protein